MTSESFYESRRKSERFRVGPLRVADARIFVETSDPDFAAVVRWSFGDLVEQPGTDAPEVVHEFRVHKRAEPWNRWSMWRDDSSCGIMLEEGYVLFHLQWELNRIALERGQSTIHASSVELAGRAVIFVGSSMSGKTTLAGHLAISGCRFIADEIVAIREDGLAEPYLRPLGLRAGGPLEHNFRHPTDFDRRFDAYEMLVPVSALGAATPLQRTSTPVSAVIFPKYTPATPTTLSPLAKAVALEQLCSSAPGLSRHGRVVFRQLAQLVQGVPTAEMKVSDLGPTRQLIESLVIG